MPATYNSTTRYRELPPAEKLLRQEVARDLLRQFEHIRGDPRLTWWQENFLVGMIQHLRTTKGMGRISEKQWVKIREIQITAGADLPEEAEMYGDEVED